MEEGVVVFVVVVVRSCVVADVVVGCAHPGWGEWRTVLLSSELLLSEVV